MSSVSIILSIPSILCWLYGLTGTEVGPENKADWRGNIGAQEHSELGIWEATYICELYFNNEQNFQVQVKNTWTEFLF
jgi:hypothetical protein